MNKQNIHGKGSVCMTHIHVIFVDERASMYVFIYINILSFIRLYSKDDIPIT